jgi:DNA-binding transcriptional LysR family regulator
MSLDFLSCLQGFVAVAEYKGFSHASRHLQISTPMLTHQIKRLEESLGKKLLHRTTRYVSLTEAGEVYLIRAQKILAEIQDARSEICQLEVKPHGVLRLSIPNSFNSVAFVKHLISFSEKYPKIQLQVVEEISPTALLDGSVDLLISEIDVKEKQLIKDHLLTIHRGIYAAPKYIKKHGAPKNSADLKNHNCLVVKGSSTKNEWIFGNKRIPVNGNYTSTSGMNILYAGLEGLGLTWCANIALKDEISKGKLVEIKLKDKPTPIKIYLYYRPAHRGSNTQLMAEHLKQSKLTHLWDKK